MKKLFLFILLIPQLGFSQIITLFDTVYVKEDTLNVMEIMRSEGMMNDGFKIGFWKKWYSNRQLADSGEYAIVTKSKIKLYDFDSTFYEVDTNYIRNYLKEKYSFPIGKWVSYYPNGKIKETGSYLPFGIVKITVVAMLDGSGKDIITFTEPKSMKTEIWKYFDENGKIVMQEKYINGVYVGDVSLEEKKE